MSKFGDLHLFILSFRLHSVIQFIIIIFSYCFFTAFKAREFDYLWLRLQCVLGSDSGIRVLNVMMSHTRLSVSNVNADFQSFPSL
jgi:hypothetical protein